MDFAAFKVALEASRSFEASVDGAKFQLRMPTEHAWRVAYERHRDQDGKLMLSSAMLELLSASVVGWDGVTSRFFMPGGTEEALPFSVEARALLLENRQDIADELCIELTKRKMARNKEREEARKN